MALSIKDFITQLKKLEGNLEEEFQQLSGELRKKAATAAGDKVKYRLVEQLQYHDILRQKLEHVRHLGEQLLAEKQQSAADGPAFEFEPGLIELSLALLRYTNVEYQEVRTRTHKLLSAPGQGGDAVSLPSLFDSEMHTLIKGLEHLYLELDVEEEPSGFSSGKYREILESFSMKTERDVFSMLFEEEPTLNPEEDTDPEGQVELF